MRLLGVLLAALALAACGPSESSRRISRAREQCRTYHDKARAWLRAHPDVRDIFSSEEKRKEAGRQTNLFREENPAILKPKKPKFYIDDNYILYAVGLLSQTEPAKALSLAKKNLKQV